MGTATEGAERLPIFPLGTVLFPGGMLPLRIFEARYMDMVRDCLRADSEFVVCLITDGHEVGSAAKHVAIGCTARIEHWDMAQLGLLNIRNRGIDRVDVQATEVQANGLIVGEVIRRPSQPMPMPPDGGPCVSVLKHLVDQISAHEPEPSQRLITPPYRYDCPDWVSCRLSEVLPLPGEAKVRLLGMDNPAERLRVLQQYMQRHQID